jgi:hypothetical protein
VGAMKVTTQLEQIARELLIDHIVVTSTLRDGHWLAHGCQNGVVQVWVADNLEQIARELWPDASVATLLTISSERR